MIIQDVVNLLSPSSWRFTCNEVQLDINDFQFLAMETFGAIGT